MKGPTLLAIAATLASPAIAASLPSIVVKGAKFFYENNGTEFFIRGVAYQQPYTGTGGTSTSSGSVQFIDPLADETACQRDLPYLQQLNTNVIRVYSVDPDADHSACMNLFANAGIYVLADLSSSNVSINRDTPVWDTSLYAYYTSVVDSLANYTNTMGFFSGNEVANSANTTGSSAFVKAATRDMKAYISQKGYRTIPVGYSAADVVPIRKQLADYLNCGSQAAAIDFFGDNVYEWCGDSSYEKSGYSNITTEFTSYSVPYFFAEYGCNVVQPRTFSNIPTMYGSQMDGFLTGGIVFEYFQETNDFGLVTLDGDSIKTLSDYNAFSTEIVSANPTGVNSASYSPSNSPAACPTVDASWGAASNLPPAPNANLCSCMMPTLTCIVKSSTSSEDYGKLFNTVCGFGACAGIEANYTTGVYGAYSMCSAEQQLSFAFNAYYESQNSNGNGGSACNFGGAATTQAAATATGTCAALLKQAGSAGTGTVSAAVASGTGAGSTSTGKKSAGESRFEGVSLMSVGFAQAAAVVLTAFLAGSGIVLL